MPSPDRKRTGSHAAREESSTSSASQWGLAIGVALVGCLAQAFTAQSILSSDVTATRFLSRSTWEAAVHSLGGTSEFDPATQSIFCDVPVSSLFIVFATASLIAVGLFTAAIRLRNIEAPGEVTRRVLMHAWRWWLLTWVWELVRIAMFIAGAETAMIVVTSLVHYAVAISLAGWLTELVLPPMEGSTDSHLAEDRSIPRTLYAAMSLFIVVFTVMNWQLFRGLLVPHGDTVMYEEHLWNTLHGKGFRSYLDQGLFLGEHIQFIHLALLPLYAVWPSHLLLEVAETIALASGAIPIFWMARRWSCSTSAALILSLTYLLYPPLQFLDIAVDLKTFRPISFGVTAMLFAFDQLERGRIRSTIVLFLVALSAKEDFALIIGPLGLWIAAQPFLKTKHDQQDSSVPEFLADRKLAAKYGIGLAVFAVGYLLLTTRILIPWFRDGAEVHYVRYFAKFGNSPAEIVVNMLTQPALLIEELVTVSSIGYLLALLLPLAFLPILSPACLAVSAPILVLLCLNEIIKGDPQPWHHFHAPVVPPLFWAAAGGLAVFRRQGEADSYPGVIRRLHISLSTQSATMFALTLSLFVGVFVGITPLSTKFWDTGSFFYWRSLYVPGERARHAPIVLEQVPAESRVASTDFIHPRFTHHERSYDYSHYLRRVADYEKKVPDDTDFIVIDTTHHYSDIKSPDQVRELQEEPQKWELLPDRTNGHFIILKRRRTENQKTNNK